MSSYENYAVEMDILPKPTAKRHQAGREDSETPVILYLSFIAIHICQIMEVHVSTGICFLLIVLIVAIVLMILCFVPIWSSFALYVLALIGLICQILAITLGLIHLSNESTSGEQHKATDWINVYWADSIIIYAGEGINLLFPLMAAMKNPDHFLGCPSLLCAGMIILAAFAFSVTIASADKEIYSITSILFLPKTNAVLCQIVKILAAASIFCTYPIQLDAAYRFILEQMNKEEKNVIKYGVRALLVILSSGFVFLIHPDRMIFFMGIIGALCLSILMYIVPGLIPFCTKNYGKLKWMAIIGVFAILEGVAVLIAGIIKNSIACSQMNFLGSSRGIFCYNHDMRNNFN
uniref:Amino acid transporter transmembrane domain-containing protein n=1 Tax=Glossina brevipalpis TaxID=37001 RepID=A0A1A9WN94_9MUSC